MAFFSSKKEKATDKSTDWSDWKFDKPGNRYYRTRKNATGDKIYDFHTETEASTPDIPRTPGATGNIGYNESQTQSYPTPASGTTESLVYDYASTTPTGYASTAYNVNYATYGSNVNSTAVSTSSTLYTTPVTPSSTLNPSALTYRNYASQNSVDGLAEDMNRLAVAPYSTIPEEYDHQEAPSQPIAGRIAADPNAGTYEQLDSRYEVVETKNLKNFWKVGRVFMMVWSEPAGVTKGASRNGTHFSTGYLRQKIFSEIRRFVVIGEGHGNAPCSPIHTYSGWATLKRNLPDVTQHTMIYTSDRCPAEYSYVAADGTTERESLSKDPIRVVSEEPGEDGQLDPKSRLNYSKVYTVEHNVRVLNIGMVHKDSLQSLIRNCNWKRADPVEQPRHRLNPKKGHRVDHHKKGGSGSGTGKGSDSKHRHHRSSY